MYFDFYFASIFFLIIICSGLIIGVLLLKIAHKNTIKRDVLTAELARKKLLYPLKIKAIERFALYLERIKIDNLVTRIKPISKNIAHYKLLLNATIEQEFNHNAVQNIYISKKTYQSIILATKQTIKYIESLENPEADNTDFTKFNTLLLSNKTTVNRLINNTLLLLKEDLKLL
jgi:hypothetical protein